MRTGAWRRGPVAALSLALIAVVPGCGTGDPDRPLGVPLASVDATADVDAEQGTIVLPAERFLLAEAEHVEIDAAGQVGLDQCVRDRGFDVISNPRGMTAGSDRRYGTWVLQEAEKYGFAPPSDAHGTGEHQTGPASGGGDDGEGRYRPGDIRNVDVEILLECQEAPGVTRFDTRQIEPAFDYGGEIGPLMDEAFASVEGQQVFTDWEACLVSHGLERDEERSPYSIRGASMEATEQDIAMALVDVGCKTEVGFVQRLADLEAALQAPVVARYFKELTAMRSEYEAVLEDARRFNAGASS